ncbi:T5orf172 domain-containing protein [Salinimicrobium catena]|uniref:T5orf172 domain-containing protein n=1 Tax=Salinimicrobium catena TaxID=390640 RepID=A0A1H5N3M8_9FLAO|nr:GIY-YIG nuclease family protein [Salinimicrobium catena]SDL36050.1 T5orf172 domain-containing protein [Salinimicrobium catena]SEE96184.1 T5orf172 domain-containing protein [Salinimicrobium catena]
MRTKNIFPKFNTSTDKVDIERLKINNPKLWKKLKKQFDTGRKIVVVQLNNGLEELNENTLRYYLMEYADRFLKYGPQSFPTSFNTLEPFFIYNHHNSILQLLSEEESYGVSLVDFLDFVTEKDFELDTIDFYESIPEKVIYHFTFTSGCDEVNFSNNGKTFIVGGLSLARQGNEVSILIQAGESFDKQEAENYFKEKTREKIEQSLNPFKKALGMKLENKVEPGVVYFKERDDLWAHNIGILFDLQKNSIDIRFVARDENLTFKMLTDDFNAVLPSRENWAEEDLKEYYENYVKELNNYDAIFDFAKYCLALPHYVFKNEERIVDVTYETNLNTIIKGPLSKREFSSVNGKYKIFAKPLYYLESNEQAVIKSDELTDESFKVEKTGFWKRLNIDEEGFDKKGNKIVGKTWVERNDIYYSSSKGVTKIEQVENFEGENAGYIYIMRQPVHEENIFKVGLTKRTTEKRKRELSNTSSPDKFFIINSYQTKDCIAAEKQIHEKLEKYRLTSRREFFRSDLRTIMETCEETVSEINN